MHLPRLLRPSPCLSSSSRCGSAGTPHPYRSYSSTHHCYTHHSHPHSHSHSPRAESIPFSWSFFLLAVFHSVVYSLLVCESPAQAFLLREQANFTGFASICVESQQQLTALKQLAAGAVGGAAIHAALELSSQRTQQAEAQQAARAALAAHTSGSNTPLAAWVGGRSVSHLTHTFLFGSDKGNSNKKPSAADGTAKNNKAASRLVRAAQH